MATVSKKVRIRSAKDLNLIPTTPRPPWVEGRHMTASEGFSSRSAYSQDFRELFSAVISTALRLTDAHLNQTLDRAWQFMDHGLSTNGINLPAFQALMVVDTLFWTMSPLAFLLCDQVAHSSNPNHVQCPGGQTISCTDKMVASPLVVDFSSIFPEVEICTCYLLDFSVVCSQKQLQT